MTDWDGIYDYDNEDVDRLWGYEAGVLGGLRWQAHLLVYVAVTAATVMTAAVAGAAGLLAFSILTLRPGLFFSFFPYLLVFGAGPGIVVKVLGERARSMSAMWASEMFDNSLGRVFDRKADPAAINRQVVRVMRSHAERGLDGRWRYPTEVIVLLPPEQWESQRVFLLRAETGREIGRSAAREVAERDKVRFVEPPTVIFQEDPASRSWFSVAVSDPTDERFLATEVERVGGTPERLVGDQRDGIGDRMLGLTFEDAGRTVWVRRRTEFGRAVAGEGRLGSDLTASRIHAVVEPDGDGGLLVTTQSQARTLVNGKAVAGTVAVKVGDVVTFGVLRARVTANYLAGGGSFPDGDTEVYPLTMTERVDGGFFEDGFEVEGDDLVGAREAMIHGWYGSSFSKMSDADIAARLGISARSVADARLTARRVLVDRGLVEDDEFVRAYKVTRALWATEYMRVDNLDRFA